MRPDSQAGSGGAGAFIIVTGMSGAGKTQAIRCLEDLGFYCVDNLPTTLIPKFADLCRRSGGRLRRVALGVDVREGNLLQELSPALEELREAGHRCRMMFMEASDDVLVRRYSETRRRHPLGRSVLAGIRAERRVLRDLKEKADHIIDSSHLTPTEMRDRLADLVRAAGGSRRGRQTLLVQVVSFGYKYGLPLEADLVMDVRFLPNPNYVPALKRRTGLSRSVQAWIARFPATGKFVRDYSAFVTRLAPQYAREGKAYLTIGIGCTGGRHRSVAIAQRLARRLAAAGLRVTTRHRDVDREG